MKLNITKNRHCAGLTIRHNKAPINHAMYQPKKGITLNIPTMNAIRI